MMNRTPSVSSLSSSNSCNDVESSDTEFPLMPPETVEDIYVAVEKDFKMSKVNLNWVLNNTPKAQKIVVVHIYVPLRMIPMMGAWFPADQLKASEVKIYRELEKKKPEKALNEYIDKCSTVKEVPAEKLVAEADNVGQGLVDLIARHKINYLIMGAAADKKYSMKMKEPASKKALIVQKQADPSCKIVFLCKGNLICKREVELDGFIRTHTPTSPRSSLANSENHSLLPSCKFLSQLRYFFPADVCKEKNQALSTKPDFHELSKMESLPYDPFNESSLSTGCGHGIVCDLWDVKSTSSRSSESSIYTPISDALSMHMSEMSHHQHPSLSHHMVISTKDSCTLEIMRWNEIEQTLVKHKAEVEKLRRDRENISEALKNAHEQRATVEEQVLASKRAVNDLEVKLSQAHNQLFLLEREHVQIQRERDDAFKEVRLLGQKLENITNSTNKKDNFSDSFAKSKQATNNFDAFLKNGNVDIDVCIRELFVIKQLR